MPDHGEKDDNSNRFFCGYWMTVKEWEEVHSYSPILTESTEDETPMEEKEG